MASLNMPAAAHIATHNLLYALLEGAAMLPVDSGLSTSCLAAVSRDFHTAVKSTPLLLSNKNLVGFLRNMTPHSNLCVSFTVQQRAWVTLTCQLPSQLPCVQPQLLQDLTLHHRWLPPRIACDALWTQQQHHPPQCR